MWWRTPASSDKVAPHPPSPPSLTRRGRGVWKERALPRRGVRYFARRDLRGGRAARAHYALTTASSSPAPPCARAWWGSARRTLAPAAGSARAPREKRERAPRARAPRAERQREKGRRVLARGRPSTERRASSREPPLWNRWATRPAARLPGCVVPLPTGVSVLCCELCPVARRRRSGNGGGRRRRPGRAARGPARLAAPTRPGPPGGTPGRRTTTHAAPAALPARYLPAASLNATTPSSSPASSFSPSSLRGRRRR